MLILACRLKAEFNGMINHNQSHNQIITLSHLFFGRRLEAHAPSRRQLLLFTSQILFVTVIVTYAFSYKVDSEMERPYQILMLFFMIGTYAMILQYLMLIPEYMAERKILIAERACGAVGFAPYIAAAMLTG